MMKDAAALADLLPAHALGALDGEDLAAVESALRVDRELQAAAAAWQREVEGLALAAELCRSRRPRGLAFSNALPRSPRCGPRRFP